MIICQAITPQGAVSADYTLVTAVGIIGILLITIATILARYFVGTLKKIEDKMAAHDLILNRHQTLHELTNQKMEGFHNFSDNELADKIILKLRAAGAAFNE